jgi:sulfoxide reductase heme-binding subunit YedZ
MVVGATTGQAMWYLSRGTGVVTLLLLTLSIVLGIMDVRRLRSERWPRFVLDALHRNVSLLVLAVLAVHVLTSVVDGFAPISLLDSVIPFISRYRPIWLGLGALALDLLVAVAITSMVRQRLGQRTWRAIHWLAYACFPVAVVHGLGTGTDTPGTWNLLITAACVLAVVIAASWRTAAGWPEHAGIRTAAFAALALSPVLLAIWLPRGPLGSAWARRAGTPPELLGGSARLGSGAARGAPRQVASGGGAAQPAALDGPFSANLSGAIRQGQVAGGMVAVDLNMRLDGGGARRLDVRLEGPPSAGGGVQLSSSEVLLGTASQPNLYRGQISQLQGTNIGAQVRRSDGHALALQIAVNVDQASGAVSGTVTAQPATAGA